MFDTQKFIYEIKQRPGLYDKHLGEYSNREMKAEYWAEIAQVLFKDWNSIGSAEQKERVRDLIKKWKAIRDNFVKDQKKAALEDARIPHNKKKRYVYTNQLRFLLPHLKKRSKSKANVESDSEEFHDFWHNAIANEEAAEEKDNIKEKGAEKDKDQEQAPADPTTTYEAYNTRKRNKRHSNEEIIRQSRSSTPELVHYLSENLPAPAPPSIEEVDMYGHKSFLMSFVPILNSMPVHKSLQARMQITQIVNELFCCRTTEPSTPSRMLKVEMSELNYSPLP